MNEWKYAKYTLFPDSKMIVRGNGVVAERWEPKTKCWINDSRFLGVYFGFSDEFKFIDESEVAMLIKGAVN